MDDVSDDSLVSNFDELRPEEISRHLEEVTAKDCDASTRMRYFVGTIFTAFQSVRHSCGKNWFVTKQGRIGYSAKPAHLDDRICYIPGGRYFQILSPSCDRYVTTAYVDDLEDALSDALKTDDLWKRVKLY